MIGAETIDYRRFWGKARPVEGAAHGFHPIAWHGLDVAACLSELLIIWPGEAAAIADCFEGDWEQARRGLLLLTALHDVGKFAPGFQAKAPDVVPAELRAELTRNDADHAAVGLFYLHRKHDMKRYMRPFADKALGNIDFNDRPRILQPIFGHHGRPVGAALDCVPERDGRSDGPFTAAAIDFGRAVADLFSHPVLPKIRKDMDAELSWRLAGLVALSDWVGSNDAFFPYASPDLSMADYWRQTQKNASRAVAEAQLADCAVSSAAAADVVTEGHFALTDAQHWAATLPLEERPGLFILEDMMGSGKTEAALILALRLMQAGRASGLYVALPTMATANALYARLGTLYRRLFAANATPSLILAHGARDLDERFRRSIGLESWAGAAQADDALDEDSAEIACARWLSDDRRKTFLADIGVGTIDQALLAILPVKHCAVRQLGLRRRVLIIDEAHAYDAYMQKEIEALIGHQAAMNAPVIVLSATLPSGIRKRLMSAYTAARGAAEVTPTGTAYPLATTLSTAGALDTPLAARPDLIRRIAVRRLTGHAEADALVIEAAGRGAAVARLCNTVDDAIETAMRLSAQGLAVDLFHARFAMVDRMRIETAALGRFGKASGETDRRGRVLVATQVIEQSLDLDFDLLVSDLAPIELLLQRAGRVWRHTGRTGRGWPEPMLAVLSPEAVPDAPADWFEALFPKGQYVYRDYARLWRAAKLLFAKDVIDVPGDMRDLVERVYDERFDDFPAALAQRSKEAVGKDSAQRQFAGMNVLKLKEGYAPSGGLWPADIVTPTRDSEPRTLLRLARIADGALVPYADAPDPRLAWPLSELSVSTRRISGRGAYSPEIERQAAALQAQWEKAGVRAICLPLMGEADTFRILANGIFLQIMQYDQRVGLVNQT